MTRILAAVAALFLCVPVSAFASTIYTYTGNTFTTCGLGNGCKTQSVIGSFTTSLEINDLANLNSADILSTVTEFSFSGYGLMASLPDLRFLNLTTDAGGNPMYWSISACLPGCGPQERELDTFNFLGSDGTASGNDAIWLTHGHGDFPGENIPHDYGFNTNSPGVWSVASVPESSTWAMFLIGFGAIGFTIRRNRGAALAA